MQHFWLFFCFCSFLLPTGTRCQYLRDVPLSSPLNNVWTTPLNLSFDSNLTISNTSLVYLQFTVILMSPSEFAPQISGVLNPNVTIIFYPLQSHCTGPVFQIDFTDIQVYSGSKDNLSWPVVAGVLPVGTTRVADGWYNLTLIVQNENNSLWHYSAPMTVHLASRTPPLLIYTPLPNQNISDQVNFTFSMPFASNGPLVFTMLNASHYPLLEGLLFNQTGVVNIEMHLSSLNLTVGEQYSFGLTYSDTSGHAAVTMTVGGLTYTGSLPILPAPSPLPPSISPSPSSAVLICPDVTVNTLWLSVPIYGWLVILLVGEPLAFVFLLLSFFYVRKFAYRRSGYEQTA